MHLTGARKLELSLIKGSVSALVQIFICTRYSVKKNYPYSGSIIPDEYLNNPQVFTMMIEINKKIYMHNSEFTPVKSEGFMKIQKVIFEALEFLHQQEV